VRSMYISLIQDGAVHTKCPIWKSKLPLKIEIFLLYLYKGVTHN
jgi:hypothetical protein